jgi:hypothetical protein
MNATEARALSAKGKVARQEAIAREAVAAEKAAAETAAKEKERLTKHHVERVIYLNNAISYCAGRGDERAEIDIHRDDDVEALLTALRKQGFEANKGIRCHEVDERDCDGGYIRTDVINKPAYIIKW